MKLSLADNILKLEPKQYNYIADTDKKLHYGIIAQDLENYFPNLVTTVKTENEEETKVVNYLELVPLLIVKIQDLQKQIDELKKQSQ